MRLLRVITFLSAPHAKCTTLKACMNVFQWISAQIKCPLKIFFVVRESHTLINRSIAQYFLKFILKHTNMQNGRIL